MEAQFLHVWMEGFFFVWGAKICFPKIAEFLFSICDPQNKEAGFWVDFGVKKSFENQKLAAKKVSKVCVLAHNQSVSTKEMVVFPGM